MYVSDSNMNCLSSLVILLRFTLCIKVSVLGGAWSGFVLYLQCIFHSYFVCKQRTYIIAHTLVYLHVHLAHVFQIIKIHSVIFNISKQMVRSMHTKSRYIQKHTFTHTHTRIWLYISTLYFWTVYIYDSHINVSRIYVSTKYKRSCGLVSLSSSYDRLMIKVKFLVWSNLNVIEMCIEKFKFVLIYFGVLVFRLLLTQCVHTKARTSTQEAKSRTICHYTSF